MCSSDLRIDHDMWTVANILVPHASEDGMSRDWLGGIKRFNEKLGLHEVILSAQQARERSPALSDKRTFLYFCGVCWGKIRDAENAE